MMRPDQRALRQIFDFEVARLRELGVRLKRISRSAQREYIARFAKEFVDPERTADFIWASEIGPVDHIKWLRQDCSRDAPKRGALDWLATGSSSCTCLRLDRRPGLPTLELRLETMTESWFSSWPGVYVRFSIGRSLVVTLDYEVFQCDLRASKGSPYR
ncbi:MAG TPA: hypothetical protein PK156_08980 [Polyangium sp.]|nr:hypothetical protein [Polyangium sp.]